MPAKPRRSKAALFLGKKALAWTCFFNYEKEIKIDTAQGKRIEKVACVGKGRTFNLPGKGDIDLFPTGVLCGILGRNRKTIYCWEQDHNWPPAMYDLSEDERRKRWYSRAQLVAIQHTYNTFGRLRGKNYDKLKLFIETVRVFFYEIDQPAHSRKEE